MGWDCYTETKPKARKPHRCDQCFQNVDIGELYLRVEGIWEGEFSKYKSHIDCQKVADAIYSQMVQGYDEPPVLINDLTPDMRGLLEKDFPRVASRFKWADTPTNTDGE